MHVPPKRKHILKLFNLVSPTLLALQPPALQPTNPQTFTPQHLPTAGRKGPGKAYRLYTREAFQALAPTTPPEILRSNLASTVGRREGAVRARGCPGAFVFRGAGGEVRATAPSSS
jgi:hypothetical protein